MSRESLGNAWFRDAKNMLSVRIYYNGKVSYQILQRTIISLSFGQNIYHDKAQVTIGSLPDKV